MKQSWPVIGALALACACRPTDDVAQTIVLLDADAFAQAMIARVTIEAQGPGDSREPALEAQSPTWPIKLVLAPKHGDASRRFTLHIEARDAQGARLLTLRFTTGFVPSQTRSVRLRIRDDCVTQPSASCNDDEACHVFELEVGVSALGRGATSPSTVDATCDPSQSSDPSGDAGPSGTEAGTGTPGDASAGDGAAPGWTAGTGGSPQAGTTGGQPSGCKSGYERVAGECMDIDECTPSDPCGEHGRCQNTQGSYTCECEPGFESRAGSCMDIDECATGTAGCQTACTNSPGTFACSCTGDSWLKADRKACGSFGAPRKLNIGASAAPAEPRFAFDAGGNGLAVWTQSDGTQTSMWTRRYRAREGWSGLASRLAIADSGVPSSPRLTADAMGRGIIVWEQTLNSHSDIWAARYTAQSIAAPAKLESDDTGSAFDPSVALDGSGNGFAVWTQSDGTHARIWANRFLATTGWMGAQPIQSSPSDEAFGPRLALDQHGNGSLVWTQAWAVEGEGARAVPWAMRFDPTVARWRTATPLDSSGAAGFPDTDMFEQSGGAIAVWPRVVGGRLSVVARGYTIDSGWSKPVDLALADSDLLITLPRVSLAAAGSGAAIWAQGPMSGAQVWANRYDGVSTSWRDAVQLSNPSSTRAAFPQIAVDEVGDGIGVWSEFIGNARALWASRLQADAGFSPTVKLGEDETTDPPRSSSAQVSVDPQGNAVVIWDRLEAGAYEVRAITFE